MLDKTIPKTILKYKGIFEIDALYKFMSRWLINEGFEFCEKTYKYKPPEIELEWYGLKKINQYVQYQIDVSFHFYGMKDVEVIKDGQKKKMQDFRVVIIFSGKVNTDFKDIYGETKWDKSQFLSDAKKFFENYIIKQELDFKHVDKFYYYVLRYYEDVKKFLGMEAVGDLA